MTPTDAQVLIAMLQAITVLITAYIKYESKVIRVKLEHIEDEIKENRKRIERLERVVFINGARKEAGGTHCK